MTSLNIDESQRFFQIIKLKALSVIHAIWYAVNLGWLQSSTREPWWLQYLNLAFLEIPNVTIWSVFQDQVTYMHTRMYVQHAYLDM